MPVTLAGSHYLPDPSFGCSFGGGAARAMMGSFVSSALFKCEVPGNRNAGPESWWGAAVLPVAQVGAAEASMTSALAAARGRNVAELSRPVPWVGALSATPAQTDSGGGAVRRRPPIHPSILPFIHSFIHPSIHSFIHSFILSFFHSLVVYIHVRPRLKAAA